MIKKIISTVFLHHGLLHPGCRMPRLGEPGPARHPETVEANVDKADWVVVDCRDLKEYAKGHIPGAISFGKECKKAMRDGTARVFKDTRNMNTCSARPASATTRMLFFTESTR